MNNKKPRDKDDITFDIMATAHKTISSISKNYEVYKLLQELEEFLSKNKDNWISVVDAIEMDINDDQRVLAFSPIYKEDFHELRYRLMSYNLVKYCKEITHIHIP